METEWINYNDEPRILSKFEKDCLLAEWVDGYAEEYPIDQQKEKFNEWVESMSWSDIDEIIKHYIKEDDGE